MIAVLIIPFAIILYYLFRVQSEKEWLEKLYRNLCQQNIELAAKLPLRYRGKFVSPRDVERL